MRRHAPETRLPFSSGHTDAAGTAAAGAAAGTTAARAAGGAAAAPLSYTNDSAARPDERCVEVERKLVDSWSHSEFRILAEEPEQQQVNGVLGGEVGNEL